MAVWTADQLTATFWFLNAICIILVAVRVYVRLTTVYKPYREILVVLSLAMQIGYCITQIFTYYKFHLHQMLMGTDYEEAIDPENYVWLWKILFINEFIAGIGVISYQSVLMLMYMDLCKRHVFPKIWLAIMVNWGLIGVSLLIAVVGTFFICSDAPLKFWHLWGYTDECHNNPYLIAKMVVSDITEVILYVIPIFLVVQLPNLTKTQKAGIAAMFSVGFVNVAIFAIDTAQWISAQFSYGTGKEPWNETPAGVGFEQFSQGLWIPTGLMVVCLPQLRVLGRWKFGRKVFNSISKSVTRSIGVGGTSVESEDGMVADGENHRVKVIDEEKGIPGGKIIPVVSATSSTEKV